MLSSFRDTFHGRLPVHRLCSLCLIVSGLTADAVIDYYRDRTTDKLIQLDRGITIRARFVVKFHRRMYAELVTDITKRVRDAERSADPRSGGLNGEDVAEALGHETEVSVVGQSLGTIVCFMVHDSCKGDLGHMLRSSTARVVAAEVLDASMMLAYDRLVGVTKKDCFRATRHVVVDLKRAMGGIALD